MTEAKQVEPRTLCFVGTGTFTLDAYTYTTRESTFRAGERYTTGIQLSLSGPGGKRFSVDIPKRDITFAILEALFIDSAPATLHFDWSPKENRVIISPGMSPA